MALLSYLISALAVASSVQAQCSTKATLTITNTAQATGIASCDTFTGSIAIQSKFAGDLAIDGVKKITGNLVAHNVGNLSSLSAENLQSIGGTFELFGVGNLGGLTFPALTAVKNIEWSNLGTSLTQLTFTSGVTTLNSLSITGTSLNTLAGLSPVTASSISLVANSYLRNVTMQLTEVTGVLSITGNFPPGEVITSDISTVFVSMPKLKSAGLVTINNASGISLPVLAKTTSSVSFGQNYIDSLTLPALTTAQGVSVFGNPMLKHLSLPKFVNSTGAFDIANNTALRGTLSFPALEYVKGAPTFEGTFSGLSLPKLEKVEGGMLISSTQNIDNTICKHFESLQGRVVSGQIHCHGKAPNAHTNPSKNPGTGNGNGNNPSGSSHHNGAGFVQGSATFAFGAVLTLAIFLI